MSYQITIPQIVSASISPNPAPQSSLLALVVDVSEKIITIEPYELFSGDLYSGEV